MRMRTWLLAALSIVSVASISACGGESAGADGRLRIAVIPKGTTHEFWKSIHAGAVKASRDLDVDIIWKGPQREDDRDDQIKVVETMVVQQVDGIVIAPLDDTALVPCLRDAKDSDIPVVVVDSGLEWDGMASFIATDNRQGGVLAAQHLGELLGGEGQVMMLRYLEGSASTTKRESGFLDTIEAEYPDINVVSSNQYGGASSESAQSAAEKLLLLHGEVDGIFCPNESTVFGMLLALRSAQKLEDVKFVGFDSSEKLSEGLRLGDIDGLVLQSPFAMGEMGVQKMVAHLRGETIDSFIDTGCLVATPENCEEPELQLLLEPDLSPWLD